MRPKWSPGATPPEQRAYKSGNELVIRDGLGRRQLCASPSRSMATQTLVVGDSGWADDWRCGGGEGSWRKQGRKYVITVIADHSLVIILSRDSSILRSERLIYANPPYLTLPSAKNRSRISSVVVFSKYRRVIAKVQPSFMREDINLGLMSFKSIAPPLRWNWVEKPKMN